MTTFEGHFVVIRAHHSGRCFVMCGPCGCVCVTAFEAPARRTLRWSQLFLLVATSFALPFPEDVFLQFSVEGKESITFIECYKMQSIIEGIEF